MQTYRTTWSKGMNTRPSHSVGNLPNGTATFGVKYEIAEVWKAPADGLNVKAGDVWVRLVGSVAKWVAVVHLGVTYGVIEDVPVDVPDPTPAPVFMESFVLTDPLGRKAEYKFVRVIE